MSPEREMQFVEGTMGSWDDPETEGWDPLPPQGPRTEAGSWFFHAHGSECDPVCVLERLAQGSWIPVEREAASPAPTDEEVAERWLAANDLYAVTHFHEVKDCAECAAVPKSPHAAWCNLPLDHKGMCEGDQ